MGGHWPEEGDQKQTEERDEEEEDEMQLHSPMSRRILAISDSYIDIYIYGYFK